MKKNRKKNNWESAIIKLKERLRAPLIWYPFPAIISFSLIIILTGHLLPRLNPRLGSHANIINFPAMREHEGSIWINLYPDDDQLIVTTSDRKRFAWPLAIQNKDPLNSFITYLKQRTKKEALTTGLINETSLTKATVVLAVDQRLKYIHLRPVLYALAEAKITRYGFETKIIEPEAKLTKNGRTH